MARGTGPRPEVYGLETPYRTMNMVTVAGNLAAFRRAAARARIPHEVVEAMGGIGNQSRVLRELFPHAMHYAWDIDEGCYEQLRQVPGVFAQHARFPFTWPMAPSTLLVLDINTFTIRNAEGLRPYLELQAGQAILTDTARGKLHVNWDRSYKLADGQWETYVAAVAAWLLRLGWRIIHEEKAPRSLTYFLLERC